ncbi:uncharacterized protein [Nicotiana sylvestris]|uniref:uncharacterized protein isoform X1 n=1 Tax=Nicotiana sylvestris TaxID=4096 RepID=UPI00388CD964
MKHELLLLHNKEKMENSNSYEYSRKVMKDVSLKELRDRLAEFARVRGWDQYHSPRNLLLALVGEVGELSEIFQWKGEVERGLPNWTSDDKEHLEEELSDVLLYLVQLADVCGLDLGLFQPCVTVGFFVEQVVLFIGCVS